MSETPSSRPRVLSGMRPTGKLHLGNYMGALANWVKLQDDYESYFFIADLHALTTDYADPSRLKLNTLDLALDYLAAGLDPERSTIFIQSHVPQHAELNLLLGMLTPLGWLERVPTYKEQQENLSAKDLTTYGFLGYPLLMSSDILLYQPQLIPVGQDQVAHVELTREVARRFNSMYKTRVFPEPEALLTPTAKLTGTDGRKMSKSYGNTIGLTEAPASFIPKIASMSTGGQRIRQSDGGDAEQCPVGDLHRVFGAEGQFAEIQQSCKAASIRCESCKARATESLVAILGPIYEKRRAMESNIEQTWEMLRASSAKAARRAEQTMLEVREIFGTSHNFGKLSLSFAQRDNARLGFSMAALSRAFKLPAVRRALAARKHWIDLISSRDVFLSQVGNFANFMPERELEEPFITPRNKRVFVSTQYETPDNNSFIFQIPAKSYEAWVLLCWEEKDNWLNDLVIPQKHYSQPFSKAKKSLKKDEKIPVVLRKDGERFLFSIHGSDPVDVTEMRGNYEPLQ